MSLESLKSMGVLRDKSHWNGQAPSSAVPIVPLLTCAAIALAGCAAMIFGHGKMLTWIGIPTFLLALFGFIAANLHGVRSRQHILRGQTKADSPSHDEPAPGVKHTRS